MKNTKKVVIITIVVLVLVTAIGGMTCYALTELLPKKTRNPQRYLRRAHWWRQWFP